MTKLLQLLKVELAQPRDISSHFCLVQQHKSIVKLFQNIFYSGLNTLAMISQLLEQAQHYSLLTYIFIIALETFLGTYYLNILFLATLFFMQSGNFSLAQYLWFYLTKPYSDKPIY